MSKYTESVEFIENQTAIRPKVAIVLGSGLGNLVERMKVETTIPYANIPHFPVSTVAGHRGELVFGELNGVEVCVLNGRKHYYEGCTIQEVVEPLQVIHELGVKVLILSNAAGGLNPSFQVGDVMLINDHINLMFAHPLFGQDKPHQISSKLLYSKILRSITLSIAKNNDIPLQQGVYLAHSGPYFGTRAESAMQFNMGADAVGMSTIPEAIQAAALNMEVLAFSVITDLAAIGTVEHPTHDAVLKAAHRAGEKLTQLIINILPLISFDPQGNLLETR